jgi:catechol 2,3-dioxygenase-like lactoylglutathione lyase family enzyme
MGYGIHHVTAIAGPARRNLDFYTRTLGLRMVKETVNFDDPPKAGIADQRLVALGQLALQRGHEGQRKGVAHMPTDGPTAASGRSYGRFS